MKKVLSIAGSDCSGGAGIQADLKTFSAHGVFGMSVIVSVVAENTSRVIDIQDITPDMIEKQIDAVFEDIEVDAVKIGMLSTPECMKAVAKKLLQYKPQNVVIDPVMYAKNGCPLMNPTAVSTLIDTVIPLADVLTPNIPEAEKIADMQISTVSDMEAAARKIYAMKMEKWDLYNAKREKSGITVCRGEIIPKGLYHLSVSVWIVNQQGQYLLSQRHPKKQYPLYWECTGGSVLSGETSLQGAIREVKEELGILLTPGSEKLIYQSRRENVQDFYDVWLFHKNIKIEEMRLQETEVVDVQWVNPDKLFEMFRLKHLHPLITYVDQLIG